jgi:putative transcriptional regulator
MRAKRSWSQAELADRLAVSRQTVNAIETERSDPSLPLAMKLARLFGARVEDLFSLDELESSAWETMDRYAGA